MMSLTVIWGGQSIAYVLLAHKNIHAFKTTVSLSHYSNSTLYEFPLKF